MFCWIALGSFTFINSCIDSLIESHIDTRTNSPRSLSTKEGARVEQGCVALSLVCMASDSNGYVTAIEQTLCQGL